MQPREDDKELGSPQVGWLPRPRAGPGRTSRWQSRTRCAGGRATATATACLGAGEGRWCRLRSKLQPGFCSRHVRSSVRVGVFSRLCGGEIGSTSTPTRGSLCPPRRPAPAPATADRTSVPTVLSALQCHVSGITRQAVAHVWLPPLSVIVCGPCAVPRPSVSERLPAGAARSVARTCQVRR